METHLAAAESQLAWDLHSHPTILSLPVIAQTVWLLLPAEAALHRLAARDERLTADEHPAGLLGYSACFERMARSHGHLRLDAQAPLATNAAAIQEYVEAPRRDGTPPLPVAPVHSAPSRSGAPAQVRLGTGHHALGIDVLTLRALGQMSHAPLVFWLEALAAQVLLDVRTGRPEQASAPLWPRVMARAWPEFDGLRALADLLDHETVVVGWSPTGPDPFLPMASPAGARRLAAQYHAALVEVATEEGWPRLETP